jgi:hypothetical protein
VSTTAATQFPARLHILLAQSTPYGVVIRRGPAKLVCTIGWNREDDTFKIGQWLKGRIYERRCDLSPDGKHLIYFAMNGKWNSEVKGSWTAISRAPYLKAIGLWSKGDCWHGGGLFLDKSKYWLNDGYGHNPVKVPQKLKQVEKYPNYVNYGGECTGVYYLRLLRDGWTLKTNIENGRLPDKCIFEKRISENWILRKFAYASIDHPVGTGCYYDRHEVENVKTGAKIDGTKWEWADVDRHRLVWAQGGKLFGARVESTGMGHIQELYDFNPMTFEPLVAPY